MDSKILSMTAGEITGRPTLIGSLERLLLTLPMVESQRQVITRAIRELDKQTDACLSEKSAGIE